MNEEYDREISDKEKLYEARQYMKDLKKRVDALEGDAMRYRRMRQLEVVIMAEDGAKYLKGKELDDYIDSVPHRGPISRADVLKELVPALNNLFGVEYAKYSEEHAEEFEKLASKEAFLNDKA
jgi:lipoate-protein ligase A